MIDRVGGTCELSDIPWAPFGVKLPPVIFQLNDPYDWGWGPGFVVNVRRLLRWENRVWHRRKAVRARFKVKDEIPLGLSFNAKDLFLDAISENMEKAADELARFRGFDFLFAPNFSIWDNYPRFDAILNLRRKFWMMKLMQERGMNVIPDVGWQVDEDFDRVTDWVGESGATCVVINFQNRHPAMVRGTWTEPWLLEAEALAEFRDRLPRVTMVLVGCTSKNRMKTLRQIGGIVFLDTQAYRLAEHGRGALDPDSWEHSGDPGPDLFRDNMKVIMRRWKDSTGGPVLCPRPPAVRHRSKMIERGAALDGVRFHDGEPF